MADVTVSTGSTVRLADTLLRGLGGRSVLLRTPSAATPGDPTEQLGLATPSFQDLALAPVVFRKARASINGSGTAGNKGARWELLISATAVEALVGSLASESAGVLFKQAYGVLIDEALMEIESVTAPSAFGKPYVYRLVVRTPRSLLT